MRLKMVFVILAAFGLWGCNKDSAPSFKPDPRPAPVLSYSVVNPPQIDVPRNRGNQVLAEMRTIPLGSTIQIRNNEPISLKTAELGQTFPGIVERDVLDSKGVVAIPRGSVALLVVLGGSGTGERLLDIGGVAVAGRHYGLEATKRGDANAKTGQIAAATLMSFRLESPAKIRELQ